MSNAQRLFEKYSFSPSPFLSAEFFLLGIHVKPSDVVNELEALGPAFQLASGVHGNSRGVIMGDLNAGCRQDSQRHAHFLCIFTLTLAH